MGGGALLRSYSANGQFISDLCCEGAVIHNQYKSTKQAEQGEILEAEASVQHFKIHIQHRRSSAHEKRDVPV